MCLKALLPYIELGEALDRYDFDVGTWSDNMLLDIVRVPIYLCPSNPQDEGIRYTSYCHPQQDPSCNEQAWITHYLPIAHSGLDGFPARGPAALLVLPPGRSKIPNSSVGYFKDGVFFLDSRVRIRDIFDGTSSTLAFGEAAMGNPGSYRGFGWAQYSGGVGTVNGINANWHSDPPLTGWDFNDLLPYTGPGSYHAGGCNFLFADGSVHFLSENIALLTLQMLTTRGGGDVPGQY